MKRFGTSRGLLANDEEIGSETSVRKHRPAHDVVKIPHAKPLAVLLALAALAGALVIPNVKSKHEAASRINAAKFPYLLRDVHSARAVPKLPFFVTDVNGDGNDDLLLNEPDRFVWYSLHDSAMTVAREYTYEGRGSTNMVTDANGDGRPEFFVYVDTPEGSMLSCHDWFSPAGASVPIYTIGPLLTQENSADKTYRRIKFFGSLTGEKGAHPMILLGLNTLRSESVSRSLLAYDGVTGRKLWRFQFAAQSQELVYAEFGAGDTRVVFTTAAVGVGRISFEGTIDSLSYVFCLAGRDGKLLWSKEVAGVGGRASLALTDINGDGRKEILVARHLSPTDQRRREDNPPWTVAALSSEGVVLSRVLLPDYAVSIRPMTAADDSLPDLLVGQDDGRVAILRHDFTIRRLIGTPRGYRNASFEVYGLWDLEGDGKREIIYQLDNLLMVREQDGRVLAERVIAPPADAQLAHYDGKDHLITGWNESVHVMTMERTPFASRLRAYSRTLIIGAVAGVLFCTWAVFHSRRLIKRHRERGLALDEEQSELLTAMTAFGHGGSSLKVLDRLRLHLKNWERIRSEGVTREEHFGRLYQTYRETVVPELEHLVMLARRAHVPEENWDTLLPRARLAGEQIEPIFASGVGGNTHRDVYIARALAALDAVDGLIAGIRLYLRSVFRAPVTEGLERLIARFRDEYEARGISFILALDPSADAVFISPLIFGKVFEALFSNAVRATEGTSGARIAVEVQCEGNYCRIDVRDNGCGIPRENWEHIFERHYTTREDGGGFGLYYAREELAKFGGKIYVVDSVEGSGTTMRAVLRKSEKVGTL